MNNSGVNRPGVLTGNRTNFGGATDAYGRPVNNQPNPGQPQQNGNILGQISGWGNNLAGGGQNSGKSLYHFGPTGGNDYNQLLGLNDNNAEELIKAQALNEGGNFANSVLRLCMQRNRDNENYRVFLGALERFKSPRRNLPQEQVLIDFANEVISNNHLYTFIVAQMAVQVGSEFAHALMVDGSNVRQDRKYHQDVMYRCTLDSVYLQFFDYLSVHPNGAQLYYRMSEPAKQALTEVEPQAFNASSQRFIWANLNSPWKLGKLNELKQKGVVNNPLFDQEDPFNLGFGGAPIVESVVNQNQSLSELQEYVNKTAQSVAEGTYEGYGHNKQKQVVDEIIPQSRYTDIDNPMLDISQITRQNRLQYRLKDIVREIPGTDWSLMSEEYRYYVLKVLNNENDVKINLRAMRTFNTVTLFNINWKEGTYVFKIIPYKFKYGESMESLVSNPEKLLPYMYDEDGIQKTSFDPLVMETDKFTRDGKMIPICEVKELEKAPNILVGNRPVVISKGNQDAIKTIDILTNNYDTKNEIDAFSLPMVNQRQFQLSSETDMDQFYKEYEFMVKGNKAGWKNTVKVLKELHNRLNYSADEEFKDFVVNYVTNLVNRWFIECRGYAETKEEAVGSDGNTSYLHSTNIFTDLDDLLNYLEENDKASLAPFIDYEFNEFIKNGLEIISPKDKTDAFFKGEVDKESDPILKTTLRETNEKSILFTRNNVMINLTKHNGPRNNSAVIVMRSSNPEIFAIISKTVDQISRHFDDMPQILIKFKKDEFNKVWVATPSGFDKENVYVLRSVSDTQEYCHPYPVCE